jgi:hypothetical protein
VYFLPGLQLFIVEERIVVWCGEEGVKQRGPERNFGPDFCCDDDDDPSELKSVGGSLI